MIERALQFGLATGLPALISFLALAIYSRLLPPAEYGRYALIVAVVAAVNAIVFQWLRASARRLLLAYEGRRARLLSTLRASYYALTALVAAGSIVTAVLLDDRSLGTFVGLAALLLVAQAVFELNQDILLIEQRPSHYGAAAVTKAVLALGVGSTLAWMGFGARGALLGAIVGLGIPAVWMSFRHFRSTPVSDATLSTLGDVARYGLPLSLSYALQFIVDASDRFLLAAFLGPAEVGRYAAAYDLCWQVVTVLMVMVSLAAFPLIVRDMETKGSQAALARSREHAVLFVAVALPATIGFALLASPIARAMLGSEFRSTAVVLIPIIAAAVFISGLKAYYFDLALQLSRDTRAIAWIAFASAGVNVVLNVFLIPKWGSVAAAWSTLIAYLVALALSVVLGRRALPLPLPWMQWSKIALATGAMAVGVLLLPSLPNALAEVGLRVAAGAVIYAVLILVLKVLDPRGTNAAFASSSH